MISLEDSEQIFEILFPAAEEGDSVFPIFDKRRISGSTALS